MVGTVGNKGLNAHRYETGTSVPVSFDLYFSIISNAFVQHNYLF